MSVPAKESITFTMGPTTWKIEKGAVGDVWSVEITCPQFKYPRFEFLLQKRCSGMNISDIIKQVAARLMCVKDKFHEDYLVLFELRTGNFHGPNITNGTFFDFPSSWTHSKCN